MGFPGIHWPEPTGARTKKLKTSDRLRPKAPKIKQSIDPWDFRYCKIYIFDQKCVDLMNLQPKKVPIIPFNISINHVIRQRIRRCTLTIKEFFYSHFWSSKIAWDGKTRKNIDQHFLKIKNGIFQIQFSSNMSDF